MSTMAHAGVEEYLAGLPDDRRDSYLELLRQVRSNIDPRFEEGMQYGMPGWAVPHSIYPAGYHVDPAQGVPFLSLANQKSYLAYYHMGVYADPDLLDWFIDEYDKTGYKLNMGKSCIRFTNMSRIPYDLMGRLAGRMDLDRYLEVYTRELDR